MKTTFRIENKEFGAYLKVTANGKTHYFCNDLTVEYDDCEKLDVSIAYIRTEEYLKIMSKKLFLLLMKFLTWILSPLLYFADNDDGIGLDKGYHSFDPFVYKSSFSITAPDEKIIGIHYHEAKYDKITKTYTKPSMELTGDGVIHQIEEAAFSSAVLNKEWKAYHVPAFTVILIVLLLVNALCFTVSAKVISEMPLYPMSEIVGEVIGMSLACLVTVALFVAYVVVIVKSRKLYKQVLKANM